MATGSPSTDKVAQRFFESTLDLACVAAGDQFVSLNERWQEVLGWSSEQLLAKSFLEFVHEDDREMTVETVSKLYNGERIVQFENRYLAADGSWHWLAWNANVDKASEMISMLAELQRRYIEEEGASRAWWDFVLTEVLKVSGAEFGAIGRVEHDDDDAPYLVTQAVTDIAWNEWSRHHYDEFVAVGLEFHNLKSLFGVTLSSGEAVIANEPASDPRRGGLPEGHPPLNSYAGIPLDGVDGLVGMILLANRDGGFDQAFLDRLTPIADALGQILQAMISLKRTRALERERDLTASALSVSRSAETAGAVLMTKETIARVAPESSSAFYVFHGDRTKLERVYLEPGQGELDLPISIHEGSCLALERGKRHISKATSDAAERCQHLEAGQTAICIPVMSGHNELGVLTTRLGDEEPRLASDAALDHLADQFEELTTALGEVALRTDIERRALTDSLTELPNRAAFEQAISRAASASDRRLKPIGVILLDLDRLKLVNDTLGHDGGDDFLRAVADRASGALREGDLIARFGGDEFAVLLQDCDEESLAAGGERIRAAIAEIDLGDGLTAAASLGAVLVERSGASWHLIYRAADSALYSAKRAGGDRLSMAQLS